MTITKTWDMSLADFGFWSGAEYTRDMMTEEQLATVEEILEDEYPDGIDETTLNDFFWFDDDIIAEWLGFEDFESLVNENKKNGLIA